jgi:hypothetical protein
MQYRANLKKVGIYCGIAALLVVVRGVGFVPANDPALYWEDMAGSFLGNFILVAIVGELILFFSRRSKTKKTVD